MQDDALGSTPHRRATLPASYLALPCFQHPPTNTSLGLALNDPIFDSSRL